MFEPTRMENGPERPPHSSQIRHITCGQNLLWTSTDLGISVRMKGQQWHQAREMEAIMQVNFFPGLTQTLRV
jgi:hypothetical protein